MMTSGVRIQDFQKYQHPSSAIRKLLGVVCEPRKRQKWTGRLIGHQLSHNNHLCDHEDLPLHASLLRTSELEYREQLGRNRTEKYGPADRSSLNQSPTKHAETNITTTAASQTEALRVVVRPKQAPNHRAVEIQTQPVQEVEMEQDTVFNAEDSLLFGPCKQPFPESFSMYKAIFGVSAHTAEREEKGKQKRTQSCTLKYKMYILLT